MNLDDESTQNGPVANPKAPDRQDTLGEEILQRAMDRARLRDGQLPSVPSFDEAMRLLKESDEFEVRCRKEPHKRTTSITFDDASFRIWVGADDIMESARSGLQSFVESFDDVARVVELFPFMEWISLVRTETLSHWIFRPSGYCAQLVETGEGHRIEPILGHILWRLVRGLRRAEDVDRALDFWQQVLVFLKHDPTSCNLSRDDIASLCRPLAECRQLAVSERKFASASKAVQTKLTGRSGFHDRAADILAEESDLRETASGSMFGVIGVWETALSSPVDEIIRPGVFMSLKTEQSLLGKNCVSAEATHSKIGVLHTIKRTLIGQSGTLALETAKRLRQADKRLHPCVAVSGIADSSGNARPVTAIEQKASVLPEEGIRLLAVASGQETSELEKAGQHAAILQVKSVEHLCQQLDEFNLLLPAV